MLRKLLPTAFAVATCGLTAANADAMSISLGKPTLIGHVAISEPVTVSCSPLDPSLTVFGESVSVSVEQASGRSIAGGSGSAFGSPLLFPCDDSDNTIAVNVAADTNGPPFKGGRAVFTASAGATAGTPVPGCGGCFTGPFVSENASVGPAALNLKG